MSVGHEAHCNKPFSQPGSSWDPSDEIGVLHGQPIAACPLGTDPTRAVSGASNSIPDPAVVPTGLVGKAWNRFEDRLRNHFAQTAEDSFHNRRAQT